ncbi:PTS system mannose/fructose/N-acetylgalactosamine-transporter subunit IIB [Anaerorhabdus furcosa]|uniref:PTS system, mannose-specific IIB component n=1 Tax=Anaerorhabdus furcosa TaxID=118967 RepID=A0A1T4PUF2_9FIRM|nr:PTS sugar transporter subunit IIB [Anaerorhabdus furcosa]SJZ94867.1 PTS system, mannose-specific IIB component [Anaerorhabdus furcosa]
MEIVNVRIDERLVHAQVAAVWASALNATRIIVIDDGAAQDEVQQVALKMACPKSVKLTILAADRAVEKLKEPAYPDDRIFIVMKGIKTLNKITKMGYIFPEVNIGNLNDKEGGIQIRRSVRLSDEQIALILDLHEKGIKFVSQLVPSEDKVNLIDLIKEKV